MTNYHDKYEPKLRIRASGYGGSGYGIPTPTGILKVPGVTTVLNVLPKGGALQWSVDNTVSYMLANIDRILQEHDDEVNYKRYRFYHSRRPKVDDPDTDPYNYHAGVLDEAASNGTYVHDWIADYVQGMIPPDIEKPEQLEALQTFVDWHAEHMIEPVVVEATVVNEELGYAGTFDHLWDILCLHEGEPCLPGSHKEPKRVFIDVKTSKAIYDSHVAQLAALTNAEYMLQETEEGTEGAIEHKTKKWGETYWLKTQGKLNFDHVAILQCRYDDYDKDGNDVPAFTQLTELDSDMLDAGWEIFKSALNMQHALKGYKDLGKR